MNTKKHSNAPTSSKKSMLRLLLITGIAVVALVAIISWPGKPMAKVENNDIVVYKTASCSCCGKWVTHLRDAGLSVATVNVRNTQAIHAQVGVPRELGSCHTAVAGDYWIEGHVPADLVQRLIADQRTDIRGLAVPGMPLGSPGMEGPNPVHYDIVAYDSGGRSSVFATRQGRSRE